MDLAEIISGLQDKVLSLEGRVAKLELQNALLGGTGGSFKASTAPRSLPVKPVGGKGAKGAAAGGKSKGVKPLHAQGTVPSFVDPAMQADATARIEGKLAERGCDERVLAFWTEHPESHMDLLNDVEDESLPPGRTPTRDESPYWMTRLQKYLQALKTGDIQQLQRTMCKGRGGPGMYDDAGETGNPFASERGRSRDRKGGF